MDTSARTGGWRAVSEALNTRWHKAALMAYAIVVLAHWAEHLAQAAQIYLLGWPAPKANGALGMAFPWLVTSEWMHYGYAIGMMVAFIVLRHGFVGRSRPWWRAAMWIQVWHHFEHLLLLLQALTGAHLLGGAKPTSIAQLVIPRVELHLFYNTIVFIPMVVAMVYHLRPKPEDVALMRCTCGTGAARRAEAAPV
ncbi:hypothetical protein CFN78_17355 [Amycolatopsis antarctica]|uniref:Uncharacterized protein n=1 Tax=Amycolatopsis antarctica TaxID=1854586 RepID=A0A263D1D2_9PSEU|nr:hypothetical protein [Amycolatopsis antarctica]OZM71918.1 hypothetical protein CFN78_17355 [Amycolatopsis antarctica]